MDEDTPTAPVEINRNVLAELARRGMKRTDLEVVLGISHAYAMRRFSGEFVWRPSELLRIAEHLGINPDDLLPAGGWSWDLAVALESR